MRILVIDDEPTVTLSTSAALRSAGHTVFTADGGTAGLAIVAQEVLDIVLTDIRMPDMSGMDVLTHVRAQAPSTDVVLMSAYGEVQDAVQSLRHGAADYLAKPLDLDELVCRIERLGEQRRLRADLRIARSQLETRSAQTFVGDSPEIRRLLGQLRVFAASDAPVLIQGESGTGKELLARQVHALSGRPDAPFVPVNCAALPDTLVEAELFGAEKGAYTGSVSRRVGRFATADGGTLFLDEVAELPLAAQAKLLRVLQEGTIQPLGSDRIVAVDVRVVSATHRDLKTWVADGRFREDLYYRLNVLNVSVPPLRRRAEDLLLLVQHFLDQHSPEGRHPTLSIDAWDALRSHRFPGNVRELEHAIRYAVVLSQGQTITPAHLPDDITSRAPRTTDSIPLIAPDPESARSALGPLLPLRDAAAAWERAYLIDAVARFELRGAAATALGISRKSLWHKLKSHGVTDDEIAAVET